jgi:hypothetical protein
MTDVAMKAHTHDPIRATQYVLDLIDGPHAGDPTTASEEVICMPIEMLDRKPRPGDWVHARLTDRGTSCEFVREVAVKGEGLVLAPLVKEPDVGDIPIDDAIELKGLVVTYLQTRRR